MKILHLLYESEGDYFGKGGVCVRAYEIYSRLKNENDITLLCRKYPGASDGLVNGLRHLFVGTESKSFMTTLLSYAYNSTAFVREYGREFDVIVEEFSPAIPAFPQLATKKPVVLQVQAYTGVKYLKKYNPLYALPLYSMEHAMPRFYRNYIFINEATLKKFSLGTGKHIEIIPNGIPSDILQVPCAEGEYILYIGRIDIFVKGLDLLLKAFEKLNRHFPDIKLLVAGDGRDAGEFRKLLMGLPSGVRRKIELPGWVEGDAKDEAFRKALFVVAPSRHEAQPLSLLEAMAYCKAVVVSDIPDLSFVTETGSGIDFMSGDPDSLFEAMKKMITCSARETMGRKGRERVKEYTWDKIAMRYENYLLKVAGG